MNRVVSVEPRHALTVLRGHLNGKTEQWISDATGLDVPAIRQVAAMHGYPDEQAMTRAATRLQDQLAASSAGAIEQLLKRAGKSHRAGTRKMAQRIRRDLLKLKERVAGESAEAEERRQAEEQRAKDQAEVERLEKELAAAKARLRGKPAPASRSAAAPAPPSTPDKKTVRRPDYDFRAVRAWAKEHDVECPARGMWLPDAVVEQWRAATQEGAA